MNINKYYGLYDDDANSFVYKDQYGYLWISSSKFGVFCFDGIEMRNIGIQDGLLDANIQSNFYEDENGNVWFTSYTSLYKWDRKSNSITSIIIETEESNRLNSDYHLFHYNEITGLAFLRAGENIIKISTSNSNDYTVYPNKVYSKRYINISNSRFIGLPWLVRSGLELIECESNSEMKYDLVELENDQVFFNSGSILDGEICLVGEGDLFSLSNKQLNKIKESNVFNLIYNEKANCITSHDADYIKHGDIKIFIEGAKRLQELYIDRDGFLLLNDRGGGVHVLDIGVDGKVFNLLDTNSSIETLVSDAIDLLYYSYAKGVYSYNMINGHVECVFTSDAKIKKIDVVEDELFVLSSDELNIVDLNTSKSISVFSIDNLHSNMIVISDTLLVITGGHGIDLILKNNIGTRVVETSISDLVTDSYFYSENTILAVINDQRIDTVKILGNELLVIQGAAVGAEINGGLFMNEVAIFGTKSGLFEYTNKGFVQLSQYDDNFGKPITVDSLIYYGTASSGLHCHNLETGETRAFTTREGLPSNNFSPNAALKTDDGRLWFGTDKGVVVFHPDSISFDFCTPRMNIEEILVNNQYIQSDTYVGDMTEATLAYDENSLAIRGVAIDCMFSPDVKSYYRFTGVDTTWKEVKNGDYLRYDRLDPGGYKLEMYALSPNLVKSEIKSIDFTINLPYWQTWWFRLLGLISIGGLVYGAVQLYVWNRLQEERKKRLQMETQQAERNRIADELHDDLGGGLSVIRFLSEELQDSAADQRTQTLVDKISSSSQQLLTSMREIIWAMDTRNDTIGKLSDQIEDFADVYLRQHSIELNFNSHLSDSQVILTGEKRRNIYLIGKEAIHNIVKHAECTSVDMSMSLDGSALAVEIKDNGKGYDIENTKPGRGTGSMQRRAQAIKADLKTSSVINAGTAINLQYNFMD